MIAYGQKTASRIPLVICSFYGFRDAKAQTATQRTACTHRPSLSALWSLDEAAGDAFEAWSVPSDRSILRCDVAVLRMAGYVSYGLGKS
jgi:hypothetical protein